MFEFDRIYRPFLTRFLKSRQLPHHEAEDVCQQVMISLMDALPTFSYDPNKGRFRGWLCEIARRRIADELARRPRETPAEDVGVYLERCYSETEELSEKWDEEWRLTVCSVGLKRLRTSRNGELTPKAQRILDHRFVRRQPVADIMRELGCTRQDVDNAVHRWAEALRREVFKVRRELHDE
ncbi:MAG: sigma-70 family RNA polymerase sigma factor [Verrucomicrobiales bacterium]|nr:sigma-70 family RNA polymerase sigma factor [Verrucomicrobiales bacterium]